MTKGDRPSHLRTSHLDVRFEALMADEFGPRQLRRMVAPATARRARPNDPATPVAWGAAAANRVAVGAAPGAVVASLGDLGVFCTALGAVALLSTVPRRERCESQRALPDWTPEDWLGDHLLSAEPVDLPMVRQRLEDADTPALRAWTAAMLPMVVEVFARQAPRWWRIKRPRFASMVLWRLAVPDA